MTNLICDRYKLNQCLSSKKDAVFVTYLAEDIRVSGSKYIVKSVHNLQQRRARFTEMQRILSQPIFQEQNNLARLLDWETTTNVGHFVFNYIKGKSLRKQLTLAYKHSPEEVENLIIQLLELVQPLHQAGFVHNDLKPANIIIDPHNGFPSLIDFDSVSDFKSSSHATTYTKGYAPPEQEHGYVSVQNDLYAIGIVALEILIGYEVFARQSKTDGAIKLPKSLDIGDRLQRVLLGLTHKDRNHRYRSCQEALADLANIESPTIPVVCNLKPKYFEEVPAENFNQRDSPADFKVLKLFLLVSASSLTMAFFVTQNWIFSLSQQPQTPKKDPRIPRESPALKPEPPTKIEPPNPDSGQWFRGSKSQNSFKPQPEKTPVSTDETETKKSDDSASENLDSGQWFQ